MSKTPPLLQIKALSRPTFAAISLDLQAGECLGIHGPSGAGKSQMLRAIAELDPADGELWLDGMPSAQFTPAAWRRQVALLPPESSWWLPTPAAHFRNGLPCAPEKLGLSPAILDQPVIRLSSGEKQRLALLRLLSNEPRVLLLDEPTANLDSGNTRRVEAIIADYLRSHDAAALWVSHDRAQVARVAGRVLSFGAGDAPAPAEAVPP